MRVLCDEAKIRKVKKINKTNRVCIADHAASQLLTLFSVEHTNALESRGRRKSTRRASEHGSV
jgi:hypothetical protein